jgi:hypothetical protein
MSVREPLSKEKNRTKVERRRRGLRSVNEAMVIELDSRVAESRGREQGSVAIYAQPSELKCN